MVHCLQLMFGKSNINRRNAPNGESTEYQLFFGIDSIVGGMWSAQTAENLECFLIWRRRCFLALAGAFFCWDFWRVFCSQPIWTGAVSVEQVGLLPAAVTRLRLWSAFWSNYRWLLLSGVLALSALGVFCSILWCCCAAL